MNIQGLARGRNGTDSINKKLPTQGTPVSSVASAGTLTIGEPVTNNDTVVIDGVTYTFKTGATYAKAAGTITIAEPVTVGDTMTIGATTYTFMSAATDAAGFIGGIGTSEAATKLAIVAAINGTDTFNTANASVTAAAWPSGDTCVVTAILPGTDGNSIVFIEGTLTHASNVLDGSGTLGSTTAGILLTALQIGIGADEAATKVSFVAAINGTDLVNTANTSVSAAAWPSGDSCVLTAKVAGVIGDLIATTDTLTHATNQFAVATLGTTVAGVDGTAGDPGDQLIDATYLYMCVEPATTAGSWRRISLGSTY